MFHLFMSLPSHWKLEEVSRGDFIGDELRYVKDRVVLGFRTVLIESNDFFTLAAYPPGSDYSLHGVVVSSTRKPKKQAAL